jgi:hypothetical protein
MKALLPLAALVAALGAAPAPSPARRVPEPYWFKTYSTAPYKEFWTAELAVKDLGKGLPLVLEKISKSGGSLTQPLTNFVSSKTDASQQLSFTIARKGAAAFVKSLKKIGSLDEPAVRPAGVPIPAAEIQAKIDAINREKAEHPAALAQAPVAAAAQDEILAHLLLVAEVAKRTDAQVLFNLTVKQR